jgi:ketosteroid isomerase-like protein
MVEVDNRSVARAALEQVCARGDMTLAPQCYAEDFVDHVGRIKFRGLEGVRRSTVLYRKLFDDLAFDVVDQVAEGDRVANLNLAVLSGADRPRGPRPPRYSRCSDTRFLRGLVAESRSVLAASLQAVPLRRERR